MDKKKQKFNSKVIHSGHGADKETGAVMPGIQLSTTFKQSSPGNFKYEYARTGNPTRDILEKLLAEIENGSYGFAFSSGMAAISTLADALGNNYSILSSDDVYGGTRRIFDKIKSVNQNVEVTYVDLSKDNNWQGHIKENTKMIWIETPSNPLLKTIDIEKLKQNTNNQDLIIVCDNTFASPYNQQPINLGADAVIHSSTKYLGGHSDVIGGGLIINNNPKLAEKIKYIQNAVGSVPSPFDCYLLIRSIKTLAVRMDRHNSNALELAKYLSKHKKINNVFYPGLETDQNHETAIKQMNGFGGIVSIDLKGDLNSAKKFLENIEIFTLAESLGGVESLIEHPAIMTHASIDANIRSKLGISDTLIRLSVGIEDIDDLKKALDDALSLI
tara:strand:- start:500 stop:1660 length:1161 start_codon:yes stop_codon:yes gene_type:complete